MNSVVVSMSKSFEFVLFPFAISIGISGLGLFTGVGCESFLFCVSIVSNPSIVIEGTEFSVVTPSLSFVSSVAG